MNVESQGGIISTGENRKLGKEICTEASLSTNPT
jgi:hypothetical protein